MDAEHGGRPSRLLTPDFGMPFFFFFFFCIKSPIFVGRMDQRKDASLGSKAELILQLLKELFLLRRYNLQGV